MPNERFIEQCAQARGQLLRYMRQDAPAAWTFMMSQGIGFVMPPEFAAMPPAQRAKRLADLEHERIAAGPMFALDTAAVDALLALAPTTAPYLTPEVPPAPSGTILFDVPIGLATDGACPIRMVTWGAAPSGMGFAGMWLSWWSDTHTGARIKFESGRLDEAGYRQQLASPGALLDQESMQHYAPVVGDGLVPGSPTSDRAALIARTALLAIYALGSGVLPWEEFEPPSPARTVLRKAGAKHLGVRVVTSDASTDSAELALRLGESLAEHNARVEKLYTPGSAAASEPEPTRSPEAASFAWIHTMHQTYSRRLEGYERQIEQHYPRAWDQLDLYRRDREAVLPDYAPLPIAAAANLIRADQDGAEMPAYLNRASVMTALDLWRRAGRVVYYVHPDALAEAEVEPLIAMAPADLLERLKPLPGHCVYLATTDADGVPASGMFVHLEYDEVEQRHELRLLMDVDPAAEPSIDTMIPQPVHLTGRNLVQALEATFTTGAARLASLTDGAFPWPESGEGTATREVARKQARSIAHLIDAVLRLMDPATHAVDATELEGAESLDTSRLRIILVR